MAASTPQDWQDLTTAVTGIAATTVDVVNKFGAFQTAVQSLQAQTADLLNQLAQQPQSADVQALTASLTSSKAQLDALANPA